jgi:hypothetical protein
LHSTDIIKRNVRSHKSTCIILLEVVTELQPFSIGHPIRSM